MAGVVGGGFEYTIQTVRFCHLRSKLHRNILSSRLLQSNLADLCVQSNTEHTHTHTHTNTDTQASRIKDTSSLDALTCQASRCVRRVTGSQKTSEKKKKN